VLDQDYRPKRFSEIVGQGWAVTVLKAVVKSPNLATRSYILHGEYGTGKSSTARVFARALFCTNKINGDACLECDSCKSLSDGVNYIEVDVTQVGNVDFIRKFKENLYYTSFGDGWRVVVFDEIQSAKKEAQDALLKLLEEAPKNTFFILNTTDIDRIQETIVDRSICLPFSTVSDSDITNLLQKIANSENLSVDREILDRIVMFSYGHVRSAVKKLNLYQQVGNREEFLGLLKMPEVDVVDIFLAIRRQDRVLFEEKLRSLLSNPLSYLRKTFELFALNSLREYSGCYEGTLADKYKELKSVYGEIILKFPAVLGQDWVYSCFRSDVGLQGFMWYLYNVFGSGGGDKNKEVRGNGPDTNRFRKR
jgi:DNA polymerase III subunit gamma/tau